MTYIFQKILLFITILSALLSACATGTSPTAEAIQPTSAPELIHLKVATLAFLSYAPFFIAQEEGFFGDQGLEVEFVQFDKPPESMPALVQGQIDVAAGFFEVSTLNAIAKGGNIKYVSDKGYLDPNGCDGAATFVIRNDILESGKLNDLKNIVGMKVALTPTTSAEYGLDMLLKNVGLSSKDVQIMDVTLPARLEGMGNGSLDLAAVSDPWAIRMINAGYGQIWNPWQKFLPNFQFSIIMFGPNLLEKNREAGVKFLVAYLKGVRQYNEGKTDRNVEIITKYTQLKPEEVRQSCWMSMRSDGSMDLSGMASFQDWAISKGYLVSKISYEQLVDLSFLEAALKLVK
jgi:NitT/TauT family transport system substrate-binding protein